MEHVPRPPPRMVRLSDLQSAWECSRSAGLEMRNPKVTLKSQIGHLEPVSGPVEKSKNLKIWGFWLAECSLFFQQKCFKMDPTSILQPSKHQTQHFQTVFQSTKIISRASRRVFPLLNCWQISKSGVARTAAATPYDTFIRPRECLGMLQE